MPELVEQGRWPHEIQMDIGLIVIYQPQPEKLDGNRLKARAAVSIELKGSGEPQFGTYQLRNEYC